jgi:hypothetical protein
VAQLQVKNVCCATLGARRLLQGGDRGIVHEMPSGPAISMIARAARHV